jgi:hypothetical protein
MINIFPSPEFDASCSFEGTLAVWDSDCLIESKRNLASIPFEDSFLGVICDTDVFSQSLPVLASSLVDSSPQNYSGIGKTQDVNHSWRPGGQVTDLHILSQDLIESFVVAWASSSSWTWRTPEAVTPVPRHNTWPIVWIVIGVIVFLVACGMIIWRVWLARRAPHEASDTSGFDAPPDFDDSMDDAMFRNGEYINPDSGSNLLE